MTKKRTYGYDEFKKLSESNFPIRTIREYEEETSVDDLGEGEAIDTTASSDVKTEEEPVSTETVAETEKDNTETLSKPIDTGDRDDISLDEVKVKINYINGYIKNLSSLVVDAEKVPLDKATKNIVGLYNIIQGIK